MSKDLPYWPDDRFFKRIYPRERISYTKWINTAVAAGYVCLAISLAMIGFVIYAVTS